MKHDRDSDRAGIRAAGQLSRRAPA
jgi:hypothetical protein